ncbi:hypothetical protein NTGM5_130113 [Candidatus Nitrotoga sp. M5]|nr:hypothetical protein NTGM5_130113 [Candidatus Nitrotoga sp. M5]
MGRGNVLDALNYEVHILIDFFIGAIRNGDFVMPSSVGITMVASMLNDSR